MPSPGAWPPALPPSRRLTRLADQALACAAAQPDASPAGLIRTLYEYNRLPATAAWLACWRDPAAVLEAVNGAAGLHRHYETTVLGAPGWLQWQPRSPRPRSAVHGRLKFYISPRPEALAAALAAALPVLCRHGAPSFKVACDAYGLLRPDKCVVYLHDGVAPDALARELSASLRGCPAHGTPFTAGLNAEGTLSWGLDPPPDAGGAPGSWRLWIAAQLGRAMARARRGSPAGAAVVDHALRRLERARVNTRRWAPTPELMCAFRDGAA